MSRKNGILIERFWDDEAGSIPYGVEVFYGSFSGIYEYDPKEDHPYYNKFDDPEQCYYADEWIAEHSDWYHGISYFIDGRGIWYKEFYVPSTNIMLLLDIGEEDYDDVVDKYGDLITEEQAEELMEKYECRDKSRVDFTFYPYDYMDQVSDEEINNFLYSVDYQIDKFKEYREKLRTCDSIDQEEEFFLEQIRYMEEYLDEKEKSK